MADVPELDPEEDTPASLEQKLREYSAAIREEFETAQTSLKEDEDAETFSIDFAKEQLPNNLAMVAWLAQNSTSDSVRLNASKYLVDLARKSAVEDGDPMQKLFKTITKQAPNN
jgi:hypothetical protein